MLDKLLNGKNLLRQKQSPEIRACAAMALGRVGSPASRAALEKATAETNPMVRNAVAKALRREVSAVSSSTPPLDRAKFVLSRSGARSLPPLRLCPGDGALSADQRNRSKTLDELFNISKRIPHRREGSST